VKSSILFQKHSKQNEDFTKQG